jgi:hypothetical protein
MTSLVERSEHLFDLGGQFHSMTASGYVVGKARISGDAVAVEHRHAERHPLAFVLNTELHTPVSCGERPVGVDRRMRIASTRRCFT